MTKREERHVSDKREARNFRGSWSGYERDVMFHNPDGRRSRFYQSAYVYGVDFDDDGRSSLAFDVDGDGDLDLLMSSLQGIHLVENTWAPHHFSRLRLKATKSEPLALGAIVRIAAGGVVQQDYVHLTDGYQAQIPLDLHFGLGGTTHVDSVEVTWPSGARESWKDLPADRLIQLVEGSSAYEAVELKCWPEELKPRNKPAFSYDIVSERIGGGSAPVAKPGVPAVVNFWSPSCVPCKKELPILAKVAAAMGERVQFSGVSVETRNLESVRGVIQEFALAYPQFLGNETLLRSFFGDDGQAILPSTFVFDQKGRLRRLYHRAVEQDELVALLESFRDEVAGVNQLEYLASDQIRAGENEMALETLDRVLAINPQSWTGWHQRGMALISLGREEEAIAAYEKALQIDPSNPDVHYNLAVALHSTGKAKESLPHYQSSWVSRKDQYEYLVLFGNAAAEALQIEKAREMFEKAIFREPLNPRAHVSKAKLLIFLGKTEEARKCLETALSLDPQFGEAKKYMTQLLEKERR